MKKLLIVMVGFALGSSVLNGRDPLCSNRTSGSSCYTQAGYTCAKDTDYYGNLYWGNPQNTSCGGNGEYCTCKYSGSQTTSSSSRTIGSKAY